MLNLYYDFSQEPAHTNSYLSNDKKLFTCCLSWVQDPQECHLKGRGYLFEKSSLVTTADVFNSEFKTIQSFKLQRFSVQQRESDRIRLFVMLRICLSITLLSQSSYLSWRNYFKFNALQISKYLSFLSLLPHKKWTDKKPKQNFSLNCQFASNLDIMVLRGIKTRIFQSALFPTSRNCNVEHEANI